MITERERHECVDGAYENMIGTIFDIKQMAVFDGPGIRTTVFLKGCPLRCQWCHNPEGLSFEPQLMVSQSACRHCGKCTEVCQHPENCIVCGDCIRACPLRLRRIAGTKIDSEDLAVRLLRDRDYLASQGGGVTFSGGEPTAQADFLVDCLKKVSTMHRAIETSGFCEPKRFGEILQELDYVIMDIKLVDDEKHKFYTGVSNGVILKNLEQVKQCGKPFVIRIPVIPGVNDTEENFHETALLLRGAEYLEKVELLPYHKTAGAKYEMVGAKYRPGFDTEKEPSMNPEPFLRFGIRCESL